MSSVVQPSLAAAQAWSGGQFAPDAGRDSVQPGIVVQGRRAQTSKGLVRTLAVASALLYAAFVAAAPNLDDGLRQATRAHWWVGKPTKEAPQLARVDGRQATPLGASPSLPAELTYAAPRQRFPRCLSCRRFRPQGPIVTEALGVSVPKARRWLVMGGHGRHGAG